MPVGRKLNLRLEIATALAVLAMLLQVMFAPGLLQQQADASDDGLYTLCQSLGHDPAASGHPAAPASDHHQHDCPCCMSAGAPATLPEPARVILPAPMPAMTVATVWPPRQRVALLILSAAHRSRAPPAFA